MKVLLVNPPFKPTFGRFSRSSRSPAIAKSGTLYYPFWLAYATGVLESEGIDAKLLDAPAEGWMTQETVSKCKAYQPNLIVVDTSTPSINSDVAFASSLKEVLPSAFVLLVGTHPSALVQETLELNSRIDGIAIGEYDYTVRDLAKSLANGEGLNSVKGIAFRSTKGITVTERRPFIEDLDSIPFVSSVYKRHVNYRNYFESMAQYPMMMIISGRGCPSRCFFCVYPQTFHGNRYRLRTAQNVVDEFQFIVDNFVDVKEIGIEDDTFTANIHRVKEICLLLKERGLNNRIKWWANTRVNLDFETMRLMKDAGCRLIIPGFESGSQVILNNMNKGIRLEQSIQFARNARKAKLLVHGCFMVGNPGETWKTMNTTLEFAKRLKIDTAQFYPLIPYPGTKAFDWAVENRHLLTKEYDQWLTDDGLHNTVITLPEISDRDLVAFCSSARRSFYLRPLYILRKLFQSLVNLNEGWRNLKALKSFLPHLLSRRHA